MIFRPPPALFFQSNSSDSRAANRIITGRKITAVVAAVLPSRAFALAQSACCGAVGLLDRPTDCGFSLVGGLKMCEQDAQRPNVRAMVRMFQDTGAEIHTRLLLCNCIGSCWLGSKIIRFV
jgi:hypothetical protein